MDETRARRRSRWGHECRSCGRSVSLRSSWARIPLPWVCTSILIEALLPCLDLDHLSDERRDVEAVADAVSSILCEQVERSASG
jgi:hypothetical protein